MGNGFSKEQAALPLAYALLDPKLSEQESRLSRRDGRSHEVEPSLISATETVRERRGAWAGLADGRDRRFGSLISRAREGRLTPSFSLNDLDSLAAEKERDDEDDEDPSRNMDVYRLDEASIQTLKRQNMKPITLGQLTSLQTIGLCTQSLVRLSPNIGLLSMTTTLHLCCNGLTEIPPEIGYMKNLTVLSISQNRLTELPDTIGYLTKLIELKASENLLESLPSSIGSLSKLVTLSVEKNRIAHLPPQLGQVKTLNTLDVSFNPLTVIPAEINRLKFLRRFNLEGCPLIKEFSYPETNSPPSLKELAARVIVRQQLPILEVTQDDLKTYLASAEQCTFCGGPFFESCALRGRMVDRNEVRVPLEYRLCVPHWTTDEERLSLLFCPLPETAPSPIPSAPSSPVSSPSNSPISVRRRKPSMTRSASASTLPLSALAKNPSLPSLPTITASRGFRTKILKRTGSLGFISS